MGRPLIRVLQILALLLIVFGFYQIGDYLKADRLYEVKQDSLRSQAYKESADVEEDPLAVDIHSLQDQYPNLVAWLKVPGTQIDEAIMQTDNNDFYLNHDVDGNYHAFGTAFMEVKNRPDFSEQNTILYGHNLQTGKQFHDLIRYSEPGFLEAHPYVYVRHSEGLEKYEVVALYEATPMENFRRTSYDEAGWQDFNERVQNRNVLQAPALTPEDRILTLQTCKNDAERYVLHARHIDHRP